MTTNVGSSCRRPCRHRRARGGRSDHRGVDRARFARDRFAPTGSACLVRIAAMTTNVCSSCRAPDGIAGRGAGEAITEALTGRVSSVIASPLLDPHALSASRSQSAGTCFGLRSSVSRLPPLVFGLPSPVFRRWSSVTRRRSSVRRPRSHPPSPIILSGMTQSSHARVTLLSDGHCLSDGGGQYGLVPRPRWMRLQAPDEHNRIPQDLRSLLIDRKSTRLNSSH